MSLNIDPSLYQGKVVCFDTETTGFTKWDEIIQISIVNEDEKEVLTTFIKPDHKKSWDDAQAINGISPKMVKDAPSMRELQKILAKIFDGAKEILGYNVGFDVRMVEQCAYYKFDKDKVTDVLKQFKKDKPDKEPHKLIDAVRFYLDKDFLNEFENGAHKADMDTFATVKVWRKQQERQLLQKKEMETPKQEEKRATSKVLRPKHSFEIGRVCYTGIGSRNAPKEIQDLFERMGEWLAKKNLVLRSGHANGSDMAFEKGCDKVGGVKEIFLPWKGFNDMNLYPIPCRIPSIIHGLVGENAIAIANYFHPSYQTLTNGAQKLIARNTYQILGECDTHKPYPSRFVICYTPHGDEQGGTGQALRIAKRMGIPIFDAGNYEKENGEFDMDQLKKDFNFFVKECLENETPGKFVNRTRTMANELISLARMDFFNEKDMEREDF